MPILSLWLFQVSLRRQEIADRLNAWTIFNDKNKEFCDWLTQMENKVCHSGDLSIEEMVEKLKKVQSQRNINIFLIQLLTQYYTRTWTGYFFFCIWMKLEFPNLPSNLIRACFAGVIAPVCTLWNIHLGSSWTIFPENSTFSNTQNAPMIKAMDITCLC